MPTVGTYTIPAYPLLFAVWSFSVGGFFWGLGESWKDFRPVSPAFRGRVLGITLTFLIFSTLFWSFLGYANGRQGLVEKETNQIRQIRRDLQAKEIVSEVKAQKEEELAVLEKKLLSKPEDGRSSFLVWLWSQNAVLFLFPFLGLLSGMAILRQRIAPK
jgi:hypothetical protein